MALLLTQMDIPGEKLDSQRRVNKSILRTEYTLDSIYGSFIGTLVLISVLIWIILRDLHKSSKKHGDMALMWFLGGSELALMVVIDFYTSLF